MAAGVARETRAEKIPSDETLATDGPGSKLVPPCGEEDEEVAEEPPRPRALLAAQTREHDRQVARMYDTSSAALPPWMRPPSRPETPVEAGAAAAAPLRNLEGGSSPGAAQSRPMILKSEGLQPLPLEKSFSSSPPAEGTVGRRGKRPSQGFAGSL